MVHIRAHVFALLSWAILQQLSAAGVVQLPAAAAFEAAIGRYLSIHAGVISVYILLSPDLVHRLINGRLVGFQKFLDGVQSLRNQISHQNTHLATLDNFQNRIASHVKFYAERPKSLGVAGTSTVQYAYTPLTKKDHIRLLLLSPSSTPDAPLRGYLMPAHVDGETAYAALSYCWTDLNYSSSPEGEMSIFLEDLPSLPKGYHHGRLLPRKPLSLTPNLISGLRAIRDQHTDVTLWVDQICINQADVDERSSQVALMNRIYTNANSVQIWFGDDMPDGSVARAFGLAQRLGHLGTQFYQEHARTLRLGDINVDEATCKKFGIPQLRDAWEEYATLASLVCRPWFSRSWIVQEVALNDTVKVSCGSSTIEFRPLWIAMSFCYQQFSSSMRSVPQGMIEAHGSLSLAFGTTGFQSPRGLLAVLLDHRCCLSTEARDKVFAFLSIAADAADLGVTADYSLCARSVFTQTAAKIIRDYPNLDILGYATPWPACQDSERNGIAVGECQDATKRCQDQSHPSTLPSWAPDWSKVVDYRSFTPRGPAKRVITFAATGSSTHKPQFRNNDTELGLRGIIMDEVAEVSVSFGRSLSERLAYFKDAEAVAQVHNASVYQPTGENLWDAFFKTITGGDEMLATTCGRPSYEVTTEDIPVQPAKQTFHKRYKGLLATLRIAQIRTQYATFYIFGNFNHLD